MIFCDITFSQDLKILSWWDYIDDDISQELNKKFKVKISPYKSNEESIAKILSKRTHFDIAILSNASISMLINNGIKFLDVKKTISSRKYIKPILSMVHNYCIPYLWSTTLFYSNGLTVPSSIIELLNFNDTVEKVLIDDPKEIFVRYSLDSKQCKENLDFFKSKKKCSLRKENKRKNISFKTDVKFLERKKFVGYGWSGEILKMFNGKDKINLKLSKHRPVIGSDYVCVFQNSDKKRVNLALKAAIFLTSKKTTTIHSNVYKYFSPYQGHSINKKISQELFSEISKRIKSKDFTFISSPSNQQVEHINSWWRWFKHEKIHR